MDLEIRRLTHLIAEVLPQREANARNLLKAGLPDLDDRALRLLHRYETCCFRRLMWATNNMGCRHRVVTNGSNSSRDFASYKPLRNVNLSPDPIKQEPPRRPEPPVYPRPSLKNAIRPAAARILDEKPREHGQRVMSAMMTAQVQASASKTAKASSS